MLNASLAPPSVQSPRTNSDFMVDIWSMPTDDAVRNFGWVAYDLPNDKGLGVALFVKLGDEGLVGKDGPRHIGVQAVGYKIRIDDRHIRNAVINGAIIVYNGGPLILENVYFVNCKFEMKRTQEVNQFASAVLSHVPATLKLS